MTAGPSTLSASGESFTSLTMERRDFFENIDDDLPKHHLTPVVWGFF
jgi:hypothetical protein